MAKLKFNRGKILKQAILMAEDLFPEPQSGKKKRKWVVDFINEHINVPVLNERQEAKGHERWVTCSPRCCYS